MCTYSEMLSLKCTLYFRDFLDGLEGLQTGLTRAADSELCPSGNFRAERLDLFTASRGVGSFV